MHNKSIVVILNWLPCTGCSFILFLTSKTVFQLSDIHLIGHDLGAHAASYTGRRLFGIGRITGFNFAS